jgi:predicted PhzF superfamily epimerase YddE/YHI9
MGRPGIVRVTVECQGDEPTLVKVAGEAVIAFQTTIEM